MSAAATTLGELKADLVTGYHLLAREGLGLGYLGHLTARLPGGTSFWSYPLGISFEEVEEGDLQEADFAAKTIAGGRRVNPVLAIHGQIYAARPEILSICHHHGKNVVALGATGGVILPIHINAARFHGAIGTLREDGHRGAVDQGDATLAALGNKRAVMQQNHGIMVSGTSIQDAVVSTIEIEHWAGVQLTAMAAGPLKLMPADEIDTMTRFVRSDEAIFGTWDYLNRRLAREKRSA
jgi:L-fuculose-phosphate aldolase